MRTNIEIDDELMTKTMAATNTTTKKAAVEASMHLAVRLKAQAGLRALRGKVVWRGHDDNWLATDEEILKERRLAEQDAAPGSAHLPAVEQQPATPAEPAKPW
jgi:Arc/MetJ family transcription regulator